MADKITVKCKACGKQFKAPAEVAGKKARCPCGEIIEVPSREAARNWYYSVGGEQKGPVSLDRLVEMLRAGELQSSDYVWAKGLGEWQAAESVEQIASALEEPEEEPEQEKQEAATAGPEEKEAPAAEAAEPEAQEEEEEEQEAEEEEAEEEEAAGTTQMDTRPGSARKAEAQPKAAKKAPTRAAPALRKRPAQEPATDLHEPILTIEVPAYIAAKVFSIVILVLGAMGLAAALASLMIGLAEERIGELLPLAGGLFVAGLFFVTASLLMMLLREVAQGVHELNERAELQ